MKERARTHRPHPDFELSRAGWELYHLPRRYPRANYPLAASEQIAQDEFLAEAVGAASTTKQGDQAMRGVKRLANLAEQLMKQADAEAEVVADELTATHGDVKAAIGEGRAHVAEVKKVAAEVRAQFGTFTNNPTEGSEG